MRRSVSARRPAAALLAGVFLVLLLLAPALPGVRPAAAAPPGPAAAFARVDSLIGAGRTDAALAVTDSVLVAARADGDVFTQLEALNRRAWNLLNGDRLPGAEAALRETLERAPAAADTGHWCMALNLLATAYLDRGRRAEAAPLVRRLEAVARAGRRPRRMALAHLVRAYAELIDQRYTRARTAYQATLEEMAAAGMPATYEAEARVGLARACNALGRLDEARAAYQAILAGPDPGPGSLSVPNALNNLGNIELDDGDPNAAVACWRRALPLYLGLGSLSYANGTRLNLARAYALLGRVGEATAQYAALADSARAHGDRLLEWTARVGGAENAHAAARYAAALEDTERLLATPAPTPGLRLAAEVVRAGALRGLGRPAEALALLNAAPAAAGGEVEAGDLWSVARLSAELELESGRPRAALNRLRRPAGYGGAREWQAHLLRARGYVALARPDSALREIRAATAAWERWRSRPGSPEWRETRGEAARPLYGTLGDFLRAAPVAGAADASARRIFDALQVFKARTLEERMSAGATAGPRATAALLQRQGLAGDDVFLDFYAGPDSLFGFALTPRALRVLRPHGAATLLARVRRAAELFADSAGGPERTAACQAAAAALGQDLLGDAADLLAGARRVIVSADGPLDGLPFAALAPGERPLLLEHEVVVVPSASIWLRLRARATEPPARTLLALAGPADGAGQPLPGAQREVEWLARHVARVTTWRDAERPDRAALLHALSGAEALHLAAHVELNAEAPWRSGLRVGVAAEGREGDYLRASAVARLGLRARLAVLSGCQSYGSRVPFGEGALGLSTAFLGAGVPCVVGTLWPVDDAATATLMAAFYDGLLRGRRVADALRAAQLALRARPETAHPFYWAGFVVVGDPAVRLALRSRG